VLQFGSQYRRALGTYQRVEVLAVKDGKKGPSRRGPVLPPLLRPSTYAWVWLQSGEKWNTWVAYNSGPAPTTRCAF